MFFDLRPLTLPFQSRPRTGFQFDHSEMFSRIWSYCVAFHEQISLKIQHDMVLGRQSAEVSSICHLRSAIVCDHIDLTPGFRRSSGSASNSFTFNTVVHRTKPGKKIIPGLRRHLKYYFITVPLNCCFVSNRFDVCSSLMASLKMKLSVSLLSKKETVTRIWSYSHYLDGSSGHAFSNKSNGPWRNLIFSTSLELTMTTSYAWKDF